MKIVKLNAENIKKLRAVEITPEGSVVKITGKNAQGKTTVLDTIFWAIAGSKNIQEEPIRHGETKGSIRLELDEMVITRTFTPGNSYLKVENKSGASFKSPQAMLDKLIGNLSFNPLAFAQASAKTQRDLLLNVTGFAVDLDHLEALAQVDAIRASDSPVETINAVYKTVFDGRTVVNRQLDAEKKVLAATVPVEKVAPVSVSDLMVDYRALQEQLRAAEAHNQEEAGLAAEVRAAMARVDELQAELHDAQQVLSDAKAMAAAWNPWEIPDVTAIETALATAETVNRQAQAWHEREQQVGQVQVLQAEADAYTNRLTAIKGYKEQLMAAARFPIEGLGFSSQGVTYHGVPFEQASSAEKLQVSLAMAMALNPTLRVIRVDDASLLDREHLAIIETMAREHDFQVWMELVDESGSVGVYIEDGQVVEGASHVAL